MLTFLLLFILVQNPEGESRSLTEFYAEMDQVLTSLASFSEEEVDAAPSTITVFTREQIERLPVRYVRELLNYVPGFQVTQEIINGPGTAIQPRGGYSRDLSNDVLFLIDGLRLNDSHIGGAGIFSRFLTLENVERVEIIRGPGSALYGSNAFQGIVNIITIKEENRAFVNLGSNESGEVGFQTGGSGRLGSWSLFALGLDERGESYPDRYYGEPVRDPRQGSDIYLRYQYEGLQLFLRRQKRETDEFLQFNNPSTDSGINHTKEHSIQALYEAETKGGFKLKIEAGYMEHRWRARGVFIPEGTPVRDGPLQQDAILGPIYLNTDHQSELSLFKSLSDTGDLVFGFFHRDTENNYLKAFTNYDDLIVANQNYLGQVEIQTPPGLLPAAKTRHIHGTFGQYKKRWSETWTLFIGARYDTYSDFGDTFNPRTALIWKPLPENDRHLIFKLQAGSAFRAPSLSELYLGSPRNMPNPDLKPEEVDTFEFITIAASGNKRLQTTVFYNIFRQLIETSSTDIIVAENVGHRDVQGVEIEWGYEHNEVWRFNGNYTYIWEGLDPRTYRDYGNFNLQYLGYFFQAHVGLHYRGKIEALPEAGDQTQINAKLSLDNLTRIRPGLEIRNLEGGHHVTYANNLILSDHRYYNRGLEWQLTLDYRW